MPEITNSKPYVCCYGEVLWDILPQGKVPGGAPMNVAIHLRNLGVEVAMISKVGKDVLGEEIKKFIVSKNCPDQWIQNDNDYPTGIVNADVTDPKAVTYEIVSPAAWDFIETTNSTVDVVKDAYAVVFGTLACRNRKSRESLIHLLESSKALKIFDVNFRSPFYSKELVLELFYKSDIVKMNQDELEIISDWLGLSQNSLEENSRKIKQLFSLKMILVTLGGDGAALLDESGFHTSPVYKVEVKDTIGSGDAFLAGVIKNMISKTPSPVMLSYACALGALVASHHGANPAISEQDVYAMIGN